MNASQIVEGVGVAPGVPAEVWAPRPREPGRAPRSAPLVQVFVLVLLGCQVALLVPGIGPLRLFVWRPNSWVAQ